MMSSLSEKYLPALRQMNVVLFVCLFVLIKFIPAYISSKLTYILTDEPITGGAVIFGNIYQTFFTVAILAPVAETYFCQYLFFRYLSKYISSSKIVLLSALIFSLFHVYNVGYFVHAFFAGAILSFSYSCRERPHPFISTALIHSVYNMIVLIVNP
jgi:membrane protease YdiL (CAAX protease family)